MSRFSCQFYFFEISSTSNSHYEFDKRKIACVISQLTHEKIVSSFCETEIQAKKAGYKQERDTRQARDPQEV